MNLRTWAIIHDEHGRLHVMPMDDTTSHRLGPRCACRPDYVREDRIFHHHSFDGREAVEMAVELLSGGGSS